MKKSNHFIPPQDGRLGPWAANYKEKIAALGQGIGLTAEQIVIQQTAAQNVVDKLNRVEQKKSELAEAVSAKKLLRYTDLKTICGAAKGFKSHIAFTENAGRELGVVATGSVVDNNTLKPSLKSSSHVGYVKIAFNKQNMTGITLFSRLKGSTGWDEIDTVKTSPYQDKRPLTQAGIAEIREYMARCYNGFEDVGQESDIVFTLFGG